MELFLISNVNFKLVKVRIKRLDSKCRKPLSGLETTLVRSRTVKAIQLFDDYMKARQAGSLAPPPDLDPSELAISSTYKEHRLLREFQLSRFTPTFIQCANPDCARFAYFPDAHDPSLLPDLWFCGMASSFPTKFMPEDFAPDGRYHIDTRFVPGSLVWAKKCQGHPWWPAMVDFCPQAEEYFCLEQEDSPSPQQYHVIYYGGAKVSRQWVLAKYVKSFQAGLARHSNAKKLENFEESLATAKQMQGLGLRERLVQFAFLKLFKGKLTIPSRDRGGPRKRAGELKAGEAGEGGKKRKRKQEFKKISGLPPKKKPVIEKQQKVEAETMGQKTLPVLVPGKNACYYSSTAIEEEEDESEVQEILEEAEREPSLAAAETFKLPPLTAKMLTIIGVQNVIGANANVNLQDVVQFLIWHFPFFETRKSQLHCEIAKAADAATSDTSVGKIADCTLREFWPEIKKTVGDEREDVRGSMRWPFLLDAFMAKCVILEEVRRFEKPPLAFVEVLHVAQLLVKDCERDLDLSGGSRLRRLAVKAIFPYYAEVGNPESGQGNFDIELKSLQNTRMVAIQCAQTAKSIALITEDTCERYMYTKRMYLEIVQLLKQLARQSTQVSSQNRSRSAVMVDSSLHGQQLVIGSPTSVMLAKSPLVLGPPTQAKVSCMPQQELMATPIISPEPAGVPLQAKRARMQVFCVPQQELMANLMISTEPAVVPTQAKVFCVPQKGLLAKHTTLPRPTMTFRPIQAGVSSSAGQTIFPMPTPKQQKVPLATIFPHWASHLLPKFPLAPQQVQAAAPPQTIINYSINTNFINNIDTPDLPASATSYSVSLDAGSSSSSAGNQITIASTFSLNPALNLAQPAAVNVPQPADDLSKEEVQRMVLLLGAYMALQELSGNQPASDWLRQGFAMRLLTMLAVGKPLPPRILYYFVCTVDRNRAQNTRVSRLVKLRPEFKYMLQWALRKTGLCVDRQDRPSAALLKNWLPGWLQTLREKIDSQQDGNVPYATPFILPPIPPHLLLYMSYAIMKATVDHVDLGLAIKLTRRFFPFFGHEALTHFLVNLASLYFTLKSSESHLTSPNSGLDMSLNGQQCVDFGHQVHFIMMGSKPETWRGFCRQPEILFNCFSILPKYTLRSPTHLPVDLLMALVYFTNDTRGDTPANLTLKLLQRFPSYRRDLERSCTGMLDSVSLEDFKERLNLALEARPLLQHHLGDLLGRLHWLNRLPDNFQPMSSDDLDLREDFDGAVKRCLEGKLLLSGFEDQLWRKIEDASLNRGISAAEEGLGEVNSFLDLFRGLP